MKTFWFMLAGLLIGCSHSSPVNIGQSLNNIFDDLKTSGAVSFQTVDSWSIDHTAKLETEIRRAQCRSNVADPVVAVIPREVTMGIRRALQTGGQLTAAGYTMPVGSIILGGQVSMNSTQTISVPIVFSFVSNIPNLSRPRLDDEQQKLIHRERMKALSENISGLIASYDRKACV